MIEAKAIAAEEARRAIDNIVRIGRVEAVDHAAARARLRIGDLLTGWLPWMTGRAGGDRDWHAPEVGEQVVALAPSGAADMAVILPGALFTAASPAPAATGDVARAVFADGAAVEYDRATHRMAVTLPAGGAVEVTAPAGVTVIGDLVVTGDVHAGGEAGVSLLNHVHGGVQPGGGQTDIPSQ